MYKLPFHLKLKKIHEFYYLRVCFTDKYGYYYETAKTNMKICIFL